MQVRNDAATGTLTYSGEKTETITSYSIAQSNGSLVIVSFG